MARKALGQRRAGARAQDVAVESVRNGGHSWWQVARRRRRYLKCGAPQPGSCDVGFAQDIGLELTQPTGKAFALGGAGRSLSAIDQS